MTIVQDSIKLCECGCGSPAPIATQTNHKHGRIKGQPSRFISGHNGNGIYNTSPERFWNSLDKLGGPDPCWLWTKAATSDGYGNLCWRGKYIAAHRLAWSLTNGEIPAGLMVLHRCDNPPCCNPIHLFLGTHATNSADKIAKGRDRHPKSDAHPTAKLTRHKANLIRASYATGQTTQSQLAKQFGVSPALISIIVTYKIWRD